VHQLLPSENSITYKFTAQAFLHGQAPEIFCQLIGLDTAFKKLYGNYEVSYSGLTHGTYQLNAIIKNADGIGSEVKVLHTFTVSQYWWRRTWFLGLLTVLSAVLFWWVGWLWQKRRFQLRMDMLQLQEEKQLQRERIRRDLHDNIGSQLSHIANQVDWIIHEKDKLSPEEQQHLLETLGENIREVLTELRDSMWSIKHDAISIEMLLSRMQQIIHRWRIPSKGAMIQLEQHVPEIITLDPHIALNLLRIFQEALSNACTHAKASHIKVIISIKCDRFMELLVTDNGVGFSMTENIDDHYGLENMQRRANEAGFEFTIQSTAGVGTTVQVKVPLE
jgi:signal transduction histidine kinase